MPPELLGNSLKNVFKLSTWPQNAPDPNPFELKNVLVGMRGSTLKRVLGGFKVKEHPYETHSPVFSVRKLLLAVSLHLSVGLML